MDGTISGKRVTTNFLELCDIYYDYHMNYFDGGRRVEH